MLLPGQVIVTGDRLGVSVGWGGHLPPWMNHLVWLTARW